MILPELTDDDKKFIDENIHEFQPLAIVVIALYAKVGNISLREADKIVNEWYMRNVNPIVDEHTKKHHTPKQKSKSEQSNQLVN